MSDNTAVRERIRAPDEKSMGELTKEISEGLSTLVRKEVELARQEVTRSVAAKAKGGAGLTIAGFFGVFALLFLLLAVRDGLAVSVAEWVADLISAGGLVVMAAAIGLAGKKYLATSLSPEMTKQTVKDDVEWAKGLGKNQTPEKDQAPKS